MKNEEDKKRKLKRSSEKQTNPPLNMIINQTTLVWSRLKVFRLKELIEAPSPFQNTHSRPMSKHENTNLFGKTLCMLVFGLLLPIALLDLM